MTPREFERSLDRWGPQLDRWPPAEAGQARALLAVSEDAAELLRAASRVEAFLGGLREHEAPGYLPGRILAHVHAAEPAPDGLERALGWLGGALWRPAAVALLLTGAGYLAGLQVSVSGLDPELADAAMTLAFSDVYAEWESADAFDVEMEEADHGQP